MKQTDKFIGTWAFPKDDSLLEGSARRGEQYNLKEIADDIIRKTECKSSDVVLDLCCGNAALSRYVARHVRELHGVDHSVDLLKAARKVVEEDQLNNLILHESDALKIDTLFPAGYFDKVYCYFSFQYFNKEHRFALLSKLIRITKPGGLIFIGDIPDKTRIHNYYSSKARFYREKVMRFLRGKEGECGLGWWVYPQEILNWCAHHDCKAEIISQNKLPHAHYRFDVLIRKPG